MIGLSLEFIETVFVGIENLVGIGVVGGRRGLLTGRGGKSRRGSPSESLGNSNSKCSNSPP